MNCPVSDISGLILAGGLSTRMGGRDKGLQLLGGRPMVRHVIERLQPQVGPLFISANRHLDDYIVFGLPLLSDVISGYAGPLAGLHAGLNQCTTPYLLSVPCDCPNLPTNLASRLSEALISSGAQAAYAVTMNENQTEHHPVFCLLRRDTLVHLNDYLNKGERKVIAWLLSLDHAQVLFDDRAAFVNINTPDDLSAINAMS
ncbi:MAG: molybdenum cofactor guanylyltransferase [Oxalobacteraceae bacterium]|jgi:molybdopterin molybdotransferase|nr:molybdenum cofactor guanylyltransferase [Oxalobacteraceae bacterium]